MYFYIYDSFLSDVRFERERHKIETRVTDLGLSGAVARLALFRNAREMIRDEMRRGLSTVVAVGNDETVRKVIDAVADHGVVFGIIPVGAPNTIAQMLGIPYGVEACTALSARRVEKIDVGMINGHRFITGVRSTDFRARITCEGGWTIEPKAASELEVSNLSERGIYARQEAGDPRDGILETVIRAEVPQGTFGRRHAHQSRILMRSLKIESKNDISLYVDGGEMIGKHFEIGVQPLGLQLITGRARKF